MESMPELQKSISEPTAYGRMFGSKFGEEAVSRVGNESRTLAAINHLGSELVAESLKADDQLGPEDRVLLSNVSTAPGMDEQPIVVVLSNREPDGFGSLHPDDVFLSTDMIQRVFHSMTPASPDGIEGPERVVLDQVLRSEISVVEIMNIARPEVIYFPRPEMIDLCAPFPSFRIVNGNEVSTSGILCRNSAGQLGVTACFHGTGPEGTRVTIDGQEHEVKMADRVQDLVFIPVDDAFSCRPQRSLAGLRQIDDLAPARDECFNFDGIMNPETDTYAQSCDPWLFNLDPHAQIRMQTTRDTDKGDSGSALIDRNDKLAGFAFRMTGYGVRPGFTDWIWAPNALDALRLTPETN